MTFRKHIYLYCNGQTKFCQCLDMEASECDGDFLSVKDYRKAMELEGGYLKDRKHIVLSVIHFLNINDFSR